MQGAEPVIRSYAEIIVRLIKNEGIVPFPRLMNHSAVRYFSGRKLVFLLGLGVPEGSFKIEV